MSSIAREFTVNIGGSAWFCSTPRGSIKGVASSTDLKLLEIVPGFFRQLSELSDDQRSEAMTKYPDFQKVVQDTESRKATVDETIDYIKNAMFESENSHSYDYDPDSYQTITKCSRGSFSHMETTKTERSSIYSLNSAKAKSLDTDADRYLRAQIHQLRHEDAIKKAIDSNRGVMPDYYVPPRSEWWFNL